MHGRHNKVSTIFISQELYNSKNNEITTISRMTNYIVLMKNPRYALDISNLAKQMTPGETILKEIYKKATEDKPFSYLFICVTQECAPNVRFLASLFDVDGVVSVFNTYDSFATTSRRTMSVNTNFKHMFLVDKLPAEIPAVAVGEPSTTQPQPPPATSTTSISTSPSPSSTTTTKAVVAASSATATPSFKKSIQYQPYFNINKTKPPGSKVPLKKKKHTEDGILSKIKEKKCQICELDFPSMTTLKRHIRKHHN